MVEHNLKIIDYMEQVQKDFYFQNIVNEKKNPSSLGPIDIGDTNFTELCSDNDHSDAEVEEDYHDHLKKSNGRKRRVAHQQLAV